MAKKQRNNLSSIPVLLKDATINRYENEILHHVNLEINPGDMVYITGPVGSGKSSLLEVLYGELPLFQGEGSVLGFDLTRLKQKTRQAMRRRMGIVFQSDAQLLYDRSVDKNLEFVLRATGKYEKSTCKSLIHQALEKVGMAGKGYRMPHELSGGEAERVCIARALIVMPDLIILDEPTSGLDRATGLAIGQLVAEIARSGTAVVMSTHNAELIRHIPARTYCINSETRTLDLVNQDKNSISSDFNYLPS